MIQYASLEQAKCLVGLWNGQESSLKHLGNFGNSVFSFTTKEGDRRILRFTDASFRTMHQVEAELEYLMHLQQMSVSCCYSIISNKGALTILDNSGAAPLICSSLSYAEGEFVDESSPYWGEQFFKEWGRNLAAIHDASRTFAAKNYKLWEWNEEILFSEADRLIPKDDKLSRNVLKELFSILADFPKTKDNYGIIHADHAPQNFNYNPLTRRITAFDFGNSCYHWYLADIAISLSTIRFKKDRDIIKKGILDGYRETSNLPEDYENYLNIFLRLRILYVYLDRLYLFGKNASPEQKNTLNVLRNRVHTFTVW